MRVVAVRIEPARCGARTGLVVTLVDADGRTGTGEATPLPGFSPDSLGDARAALQALAERLPLDVVPDPATVAIVVGTLPARVPSARFAVETALLDLVAAAEDVSLATLLRGGPAPHLVRHAALLAAPGTAEALAEASRAVARGIRTLKRKVRGRSFDEELALLSLLHGRFGADVELRVDANGAWTPDEARLRLEALSRVGVALVEEPTHGRDLCALGRVAVPWAADESLADPALVERLLCQPSCAALVLKPMLLGGSWRCLALAELADQYDRDLVVTHLFDGPIALGACEALAAALPRAPLACGLDAAHLDRQGTLAEAHAAEAHA
jgi:o-succinylbenzoate synthase